VFDTKTVSWILRSRDTAHHATGLNSNRFFATLNPKVLEQNSNAHLKKPAHASVYQAVPKLGRFHKDCLLRQECPRELRMLL